MGSRAFCAVWIKQAEKIDGWMFSWHCGIHNDVVLIRRDNVRHVEACSFFFEGSDPFISADNVSTWLEPRNDVEKFQTLPL